METGYQQAQYILVFTNYCCCQILYISFLLKIETEKAKLDPKISLFLKILSLDFFHSFHDISWTSAPTWCSPNLFARLLSLEWRNRIMNPAGSYLFKVNNRSTRTTCEICWKLTKKIPDWCHAYCSLRTYFTHCSDVCNIYFDQGNAGWEY